MLDYERLGRYKEALDDANKVLRLAPNAAESYGNIGVFLNRLGDYENALRAARDAMRLNPNYPDAHCVAGYALQGLEDHKAAIPEYQKAIQLKPDYVEALVDLGNAYFRALKLDRFLASWYIRLSLLLRRLKTRPHWPFSRFPRCQTSCNSETQARPRNRQAYLSGLPNTAHHPKSQAW